jgi:hypothetical protein
VEPISLGAELIKQLASQGTPWLVTCLVGIVAYLFYMRSEAALKNCAVQSETAAQLRDQLQEKRVDEARGYIKVFSEGTQTNEKLASAISLRTETLQTVSQIVLQLQRDVQAVAEAVSRAAAIALDIQGEQNAREAAWQVRLKQIEETLRDNGKRIESLAEEARKAR